MISATLEHLNRTVGFFSSDGGGPLEVLLAGASAGGIGTNNNCDFVADTVRGYAASSDNSSDNSENSVVVRCNPQSGLFFPPDTDALWAQRLGLGRPTNEIAAFYIADLYDAFVDESCAASLSAAGQPAELCWDAPTALRHVTTKVLVAQNFWDQLQIDDILCFQDNLHGLCPDRWMDGFMNRTLSFLREGFDERGAAAWAPSCFAHTDDMCLVPITSAESNSSSSANVTVVNGVALRDALAAWVAEDANPPLLIDDCMTPGDKARSTPCNTLCKPGCGAE